MVIAERILDIMQLTDRVTRYLTEALPLVCLQT